jgi:hypothetical protein
MEKFKTWINKHKVLSGVLVGVFVVLLYLFYNRTSNAESSESVGGMVYSPNSGGSGGSSGSSSGDDTQSIMNTISDMFTSMQEQNEKFYSSIQDQNENMFDYFSKSLKKQSDSFSDSLDSLNSQLSIVRSDDVKKSSSSKDQDREETSSKKSVFDIGGFIDDIQDQIQGLKGNVSATDKAGMKNIHGQVQSLRHTIAGTIDKKASDSGYSYKWEENQGYNQLVVTDNKGKKTVI